MNDELLQKEIKATESFVEFRVEFLLKILMERSVSDFFFKERLNDITDKFWQLRELYKEIGDGHEEKT